MAYLGEKLQLAHLCLKMRIHGKVVEHRIDLRIWQGRMGKGTACYLVSVLQRKQFYFTLNMYA